MDMKGSTVDVSSYLCFEATGDSDEAPSCEPIKDPNIACRIPICDDEDDAQSCCYDTSDESLINSHELIINELEVCVHGTTYQEEEDENHDDDHHHHDCEIEEEKKGCVCVNSGAEKMDEMEKNRLFWEACLAS